MFEAIRERQDPDVARRVVELYEFMRDESARIVRNRGQPGRDDMAGGASRSRGVQPDRNGLSPDWVSIEFRFVRDKRSPAELTRLADLIRQIPGARRYLEGIEHRDFRAISGMGPEVVLASDQALEAFKSAVAEAVRPPGST